MGTLYPVICPNALLSNGNIVKVEVPAIAVCNGDLPLNQAISEAAAYLAGYTPPEGEINGNLGDISWRAFKPEGWFPCDGSPVGSDYELSPYMNTTPVLPDNGIAKAYICGGKKSEIEIVYNAATNTLTAMKSGAEMIVNDYSVFGQALKDRGSGVTNIRADVLYKGSNQSWAAHASAVADTNMTNIIYLAIVDCAPLNYSRAQIVTYWADKFPEASKYTGWSTGASSYSRYWTVGDTFIYLNNIQNYDWVSMTAFVYPRQGVAVSASGGYCWMSATTKIGSTDMGNARWYASGGYTYQKWAKSPWMHEGNNPGYDLTKYPALGSQENANVARLSYLMNRGIVDETGQFNLSFRSSYSGQAQVLLARQYTPK